MARPTALHFDPYRPPVILVPLRIGSVKRYSRQLFEIRGHVGDYELVIRRPAAELPTSPTMLTELQVTRFERYTRDKMARVWGWVGDYEACVALPTNDGRIRSLMDLHKRGQQLAATAREG